MLVSHLPNLGPCWFQLGHRRRPARQSAVPLRPLIDSLWGFLVGGSAENGSNPSPTILDTLNGWDPFHPELPLRFQK